MKSTPFLLTLDGQHIVRGRHLDVVPAHAGVLVRVIEIEDWR